MGEVVGSKRSAWRARARALGHVPALLRLAWEAGSWLVCAAFCGRVVGALLPLAMLTVAKTILDALQQHFSGATLRSDFWWFVALDCALSLAGVVIGRVTGFLDGLFDDRFTRHVS